MSDPEQTPLLQRLDRIAAALENTTGSQLAASSPPAGRAVLWDPRRGFATVHRPARIDPSLFVGIGRQQEAFYANVRRFLGGVPAHDVLLWGDRGTGKSSLVRSLLVAVDDPKLAILAVAEADLADLPLILECLGQDRRRWILFCDDLSFRGTDTRYREFKVLLEGGLETRPQNTLLVATSNRRHLVPEHFDSDTEIHPEETVAEEVSLADRFGLSLGFYPFNQSEYLEAVARHLAVLGCDPPPAEWPTHALRWAMARGIRSGRSAQHAARELAGGVAMP